MPCAATSGSDRHRPISDIGVLGLDKLDWNLSGSAEGSGCKGSLDLDFGGLWRLHMITNPKLEPKAEPQPINSRREALTLPGASTYVIHASHPLIPSALNP